MTGCGQTPDEVAALGEAYVVLGEALKRVAEWQSAANAAQAVVDRLLAPASLSDPPDTVGVLTRSGTDSHSQENPNGG